MSILPITNIVNVTITQTPQGIGERNVNSIALFTHEPVDTLNSYEVVVSPSQVAELCGTDSLTARMANALFAQTPNIRTGNGRLCIIPMHAAVSATEGMFTTADLTDNIVNLIGVTNGDIRLTVNGTQYNLTGLDFTNCEDLEDIALVLGSALVDVSVSVYEDSSETGLVIKSKKVGTASTVTMSAVSAGTGTNLAGSTFFNSSAGVSDAGTDSSGETMLEAIARMEGAVGFVGMLTTLSLDDTALLATANGVQSMDKLFHYASGAAQDILGIGTTIKSADDKKTRFKVYTPGIEDAKLMNAAYVGRAHSVNMSGSATAQTMNLKGLATILPDTGITQTMYVQADTAGVDLYVSYEGVAAVYSTGGNDYFDNQYANLALKFALETAGFNYLRQTNTKVPQTEPGMSGLKSAYSNVMERFVRNGYLAPGSWTSSERFGDPEIFDTNILTKGYYIYSLPIVQQSSVEREHRIAPLVQIAAKRAGAIHRTDVIVLVNA